MAIDIKYAYLVGCSFFLFIWLLLFFFRKDLRKEILTMSFLIAPFGLIGQIFYLRDYWQPQTVTGWSLGFEDLLFAFSIGGVGAVVYEEILGKKFSQRRLKKYPYWMLLVIFLGLSWMIIGNIILKFNSIYVSTSVFLIFGVLMVTIRQDLIRNAFVSGVLVGLLMFFFYLLYLPLHPGIIEKFWRLKNISGIFFLGVPLEELMWGFGWGFVAGPLYEFINGLQFKEPGKN